MGASAERGPGALWLRGLSLWGVDACGVVRHGWVCGAGRTSAEGQLMVCVGVAFDGMISATDGASLRGVRVGSEGMLLAGVVVWVLA